MSKELHGTIIRDIQEGVEMESRQPLFTVVTVTLNCAEDACRTAQSVLDQDFNDYEYVVKDGGSTDGTIERVRDLGISVWVSEDSGIYDAMNKALVYCSGEYILFLNAGDLLYSAHTLRRVAEWQNDNNMSEFAYGDVQSYAKHPFVDRLAKGIKYRNHLSRFYLYRKMICHQAWFVHTAVFSKYGGFNVQYPLSADYEFLLKMVLQNRARYSHMPFFVATYKGGGASEIDNPRVAQEKNDIQKRYFPRWERIFYKFMYHTVWFIGKRIVYRFIWLLPPSLKGRALGW